MKTLYRLRPLVAAYAGSQPRCWRDKRSLRCWRTHRASQSSRRWRRGTGGDPGIQRKRCWGNHGRWLLQCCDRSLWAGQREGWNLGTALQTWHFPGAVSPTRQCHIALTQSRLLWCSSADTGAPQLSGKIHKINTLRHDSDTKLIFISPLVYTGMYHPETSSTFLMSQDVPANRQVLMHWNDRLHINGRTKEEENLFYR